MNPALFHSYPNKDVAILVVSCDQYQDLWPLFFHGFNKYWPNCPYPVFLGTNELHYPDPRVVTLNVGLDIDYSTNLMKMLMRLTQEWVILWIEDRFLSANVDTERIRRLIAFTQYNDLGYLKLINNYPLAHVHNNSLGIGEIPVGVRYRVSITVALWKKAVILSLLQPGESAWDLERRGSIRSNALNAKFYCISSKTRHNPPLQEVHGVMKRRWTREGIRYLRSEGLLQNASTRSIQSLSTYIYTKLYMSRLKIYEALGLHWWQKHWLIEL